MSGRRRFGAAVLAVVAGSGITAGVAASAADLVPPEPDAELLDLCARFDAIEQVHYAEFMRWTRDEDEDRAHAAMERMGEEHDPLLDRIVELPPTTFAGAVALARTLEQWTHGDFAGGEGYTDQMLARTLLDGLVAAGGPSTVTLPARVALVHPDTALIALCTQYVDRTRAERASVEAMTEQDRRSYYLASVRDRDRVDELLEQIAAMPAQGPGGRAAKARALIWYYGGSDDHDPFGWRREDALLASLVSDVGGRA